MSLSLADLELLVEALGQLDLEYGRPDAVALADRVRSERDARKADAR
jgi:hypothetical protein